MYKCINEFVVDEMIEDGDIKENFTVKLGSFWNEGKHVGNMVYLNNRTQTILVNMQELANFTNAKGGYRKNRNKKSRSVVRNERSRSKSTRKRC
jgi:hypothetical protein